jgi:NADH:ubiquinone reductase (H+-translocating)
MRRIVIVGGGIAGIVTATRRSRHLSRDKVAEILLIDKNAAHVWKPMLHTFAAGTANYANESISFIYHAKRNGLRFWPGDLCGLDRGRKLVHLGPVLLPNGTDKLPGRAIPYDILIIAVGSRANDFGTPGVGARCHFMNDIGDAEKFNAILRSRIFQAVDAHRDLRLLIVGGGATGVELAAELRLNMETLTSYAPQDAAARLRSMLRITLIEAGPRLLGPFPERISVSVEKKLAQLDVEVRTKTKVVGADTTGVTLEQGQHLAADLLVWTAGIKGPDVLSRLDKLDLSRTGQIVIRPTLQSKTDDMVFALGDCASLLDPNERPLPATAQVARQQAVFLARSLANNLKQGASLQEFSYRDMGGLVALGDHAAFGTLGPHGFLRDGFIKGRFAQLVHAALYRMHQLDLNGPLRGGLGWLASDLMRVARPRIRLG